MQESSSVTKSHQTARTITTQKSKGGCFDDT